MRSPIVEITCTLRAACPSGLLPSKKGKSLVGQIPFEEIARAILGARYELSLVICGNALAKRLNLAHRKKNNSANVLSFPLNSHEGEIFLNIRKAAREAREYGISIRERVTHLFAHGCLHLKGVRHGARMDALEKKAIERFL